MQKVELPIEIEKKDLIKPGKPDFSWLFRMLVLITIIIVFLYSFFKIFSFYVIKYLPIEKEIEFFWGIINYTEQFEKFEQNKLTNKFLIDDRISIYISESEEINAFATIWWNIIINKWLLKNIDYEEELIFIIWHEMSHIENRDMLKSILEEIPFTIALKLLWIDVDFKITNLSELINSYSSKKLEIRADENWARLINDTWLNLNCALNFFKDEENIFLEYLNLASTHPTNKIRIKKLEENILYPEKKCNNILYLD